MKLIDHLFPGAILSMSTRTAFGWLIRASLGKAYRRLTGAKTNRFCPNHDALVVECGGTLYIGDCVPPHCRLTPVEDYERWIAEGEIFNLSVLNVSLSTITQGYAASEWWLRNVNNTPYDLVAFPRLFLKAVFGDWIPAAAGMEFAHWCTESVMQAWRDGAQLDPYQNNNPTPFTTLKRRYERKLGCVARVKGNPQ